MFHVLMVCTGNICRSTMAQQVLTEVAKAEGVALLVDSAGTSDEEHGNPIYPPAARVLREFGHDIPDHRARRVRGLELSDWDLVLAMTGGHVRTLERLAAQSGVEVVRNPLIGAADVTDIRLFREFDPAVSGDEDVPDPWYGGHEDYVETLETIERVTPHLLDAIRGRLSADVVGGASTR